MFFSTQKSPFKSSVFLHGGFSIWFHEVIFVLLVTAVGNDFLDFCKASHGSGGQSQGKRQVCLAKVTIWLWHSQFAMERSAIFKFGKPSISIRAIYTMAMWTNQRVLQNPRETKAA